MHPILKIFLFKVSLRDETNSLTPQKGLCRTAVQWLPEVKVCLWSSFPSIFRLSMN